jgi:hypothetical protein
MNLIIKKLTFFTLPQLLLASLITVIPIQITASTKANATGSCYANGSVAQSSASGFVTTTFTLTSAANNSGNLSSCTYTVACVLSSARQQTSWICR